MHAKFGPLAAVAAIILLGIAPALADCRSDSLDSVSADGEILKMLSGEIYEVDAVDAADSALWLPVSDVLICGYGRVTIINTDDDGEKVGAKQLR